MQLIPFQEQHFQTLINWIIDEETMLCFAGIAFDYPLTHEQLTGYISKHPERLIYLFVDGDLTSVGYGEIIPQDDFSARLGHLIIGESQKRGKDWGSN